MTNAELKTKLTYTQQKLRAEERKTARLLREIETIVGRKVKETPDNDAWRAIL